MTGSSLAEQIRALHEMVKAMGLGSIATIWTMYTAMNTQCFSTIMIQAFSDALSDANIYL